MLDGQEYILECSVELLVLIDSKDRLKKEFKILCDNGALLRAEIDKYRMWGAADTMDTLDTTEIEKNELEIQKEFNDETDKYQLVADRLKMLRWWHFKQRRTIQSEILVCENNIGSARKRYKNARAHVLFNRRDKNQNQQESMQKEIDEIDIKIKNMVVK